MWNKHITKTTVQVSCCNSNRKECNEMLNICWQGPKVATSVIMYLNQVTALDWVDMLLFNLIRGLNFISRYFKLINIHLIPPTPITKKRKYNFNRGRVMLSSVCHRFPALYSNHTLLIGLLLDSTVRVNGYMWTCDSLWVPCLTTTAKLVIFAFFFLTALCDNYFSQQCR